MSLHSRCMIGCIALLAFAAPSGAANAATLFGLLDTGELFASGDGGVSWTARGLLPARDAVALAAGATSSELFLATETGSVHRSVDAGAHWTAVGTVAAEDVAALVTEVGRLVLITRSGSVWSSIDAGASFSATGAITASDVVSAARIGPNLFTVTATGVLYRSSDAGASWSALSTLAAHDVVALAATGGRLFALAETGEVAMAHPPWTHWSVVGILPQSGMAAMVASSGELVVGAVTGEVAASADAASWTWRGAMGQLGVRALGSDVAATSGVSFPPSLEARFSAPWPNPARHRVELGFDLPAPAEVTLEVFDTAGRRIATPMFAERLPAGPTRRAWHPGPMPAGVYYLRARTAEETVGWRRVIWMAEP